jgi:hypothetical protein
MATPVVYLFLHEYNTLILQAYELTSPLYEIIYRLDWWFYVRPAGVFLHLFPVRNCVMVKISPVLCLTVMFKGASTLLRENFKGDNGFQVTVSLTL